MVDFQSRFRLYGYSYTSPELKYPVATKRELYHETAPDIFKRRPTAHDCRAEAMQEHTDRRDWEAWLLAHGLTTTCTSAAQLHYKEVEERPKSGTPKTPDKLLFDVGIRGRGDGDFLYPRGLTATVDGDILVADTGNHRLQVLSEFGFFKKKFGKKGKGNGEFDEPTGVVELPNGDIAVADKNNKRIQVFSCHYVYKFHFDTVERPYCIACDNGFNMAVSTTSAKIEVYRRGGKLINRFSIGGKKVSVCAVQICVNNKDEVIVCDPADCLVKYYTYSGQLLYQFEPLTNAEGLSVVPSGICLTPLNQLIIADALNHTVNLYTERGVLLQEVVCPTDDAGSVQTCTLGPEGHLVVTEFTVVGRHCVKYFRYRNCICHMNRPGSSKRRTPTSPS